jgi:hypothetical protein
LVAALWANAALLAVIVLTMLNRGTVPSVLPAAYAQNQPPIAGGAGVFVMPAQMATNVWGAYLLDVDSKTICAYQFFPGEKKLRLSAARSYKYDTKLENFNTDIPPREVKAMVEKAQAGGGAEVPQAGEGKDKDK